MATMAELAQEIEHLTPEHLMRVLRSIESAPPPITDDFLQFGLATEVLRFYFGNRWTNEMVFSMHPEVSSHHRQGRLFLKTDSTMPDDQFRHLYRVVNLAEIVYNLQRVQGLKERIIIMDKNDLESAYGEMQCAALLSSTEMNLRFINPKGSKGHDYEVELTSSANRTVCCEIKTKLEATSFDVKTLWSTLDAARKQLPKQQPGLILVKIPEAWPQRHRQTDVGQAISKALRQSDRLVGIVLLWEEWFRTPEGANICISRFKQFPNKKSTLFQTDIEILLASIGRVNNPNWFSFRAFVTQMNRANE